MTIAQQLNIKEFPFEIKDKDGRTIYYEYNSGYWIKYEYDSNCNEFYFEDSGGFWEKNKYDSNNKQIYFENSNGYWDKREYDSNGNQIYYENSDGKIRDNRPKGLTNAEIAEKLEEIVKLLKSKS